MTVDRAPGAPYARSSGSTLVEAVANDGAVAEGSAVAMLAEPDLDALQDGALVAWKAELLRGGELSPGFRRRLAEFYGTLRRAPVEERARRLRDSADAAERASRDHHTLGPARPTPFLPLEPSSWSDVLDSLGGIEPPLEAWFPMPKFPTAGASGDPVARLLDGMSEEERARLEASLASTAEHRPPPGTPVACLSMLSESCRDEIRMDALRHRPIQLVREPAGYRRRSLLRWILSWLRRRR